MNTKIVTFSICSLLFMAMPLIAAMDSSGLALWLEIVLVALSFIFAVLAISYVVVEILRLTRDEALFETKATLEAAIDDLETTKKSLQADVAALEDMLKKGRDEETELQAVRIKELEQNNKELRQQLGAVVELREKFGKIETIIING